MTKTTNYEISKKLEEIGFKADAEKCWAKIRHYCLGYWSTVSSEFVLVNLDFQVPQNCDEWVLSYDLEILLDALPSEIEYFGNDAYFRMSKDQFWYEEFCNCPFDCPVKRHYNIKIKENESLADTAGRLIILLHENNLIKF
jgi:hypothetical protein